MRESKTGATWSRCYHRRPRSPNGSAAGKDENNNDLQQQNNCMDYGERHQRDSPHMKLSHQENHNKSDEMLKSHSSSSYNTNYNKHNSTTISRDSVRKWTLIVSLPLLLLILAPVGVDAVCVWQGGGGFRLACGFRQSGLFRIRSLGGLKGYLGAGFTIGDEDGFKDSLTNTDPVNNGHGQIPSQAHNGQIYPNGYQRIGTQGQLTNTNNNNGGVPLSLDEIKKQEQLRYLQQIQTEQMLEHQILQQQASVKQQRQEKNLFQNRRLPLPSPTYPANNNPARSGGITKRASMWRWPFRGGNKNKPGPNPQHEQIRGFTRGPVAIPIQKMSPHQNQQQMSQSQMRPVVYEGPPPNFGGNGKRPVGIPIPVPFQRGQGGFSQFGPNVGRQGHLANVNLVIDDDYVEVEEYETGSENQIQHPPQKLQPQQRKQHQQQFNMPNQFMIPPPSPSGPFPQFRRLQNYPSEDISHLQMPPRPHPSQIPHGLQMLQNTQNFGSVYKLIDQQQQTQLHRQLPTDEEDEESIFLSGLGNLDKDALATAVYDPNVFPDIYFTSTTERGNNLEERMENQMENHEDMMDESELNKRLDTVENMEKVESEVHSPEKTNKRRRKKKFRLLKKKGEISSDVDQNLEEGEQFRLETEDQQTTRELLDQQQQIHHPHHHEQDESAILNNTNMDQDFERENSNNHNADATNIYEEEKHKDKKRRRKKGKRRKKPHHLRNNNNNNSSFVTLEEQGQHQHDSSVEKIREAISHDDRNAIPVSGPSPMSPPHHHRNNNRYRSTTTTSTTTTTEAPTTTTPRIEMSTFGYFEALDSKVNPSDPSIKYHHTNNPHHKDALFSSGSSSVEREQRPYDPRFPPDHEMNRGRLPNKFVRQRGPTTTATPFVSGGLNIISPQKKYYNDDYESEMNLPDSTPHTVKFTPSTEYSSSFVHFDSRESLKSVERTRHYNDKFYNSHFNKSNSNSGNNNNNNNAPNFIGGTGSFSNNPGGFYDFSPNFSHERNFNLNYPPFPTPPEDIILPWEKDFFSSSFPTTTSTTRRPVPIYPKSPSPTHATSFNSFHPTSTGPDLKKTIFGGEEDHSGNWEAPNFWGSIQQVDRFGPSSDFVTNDNFKRVLSLERENFNPDFPPQPPSMIPMTRDENFPSYFAASSTTPNPTSPQWTPPKRKLNKSRPIPTVPSTTPTPYFYESSISPNNNNYDDDEQFGMKLEQLPVKELDIDNLGNLNSFNFISSTTASSTSTTTTEVPQTISNIRNKHSRNKKRKQKRPDVQIKIKGENQPESQNPVILPNTAEVVDILENEDMKAKGSFVNEKSSRFGDSEHVNSESEHIAQNGFDGNFVPSSSPFLEGTNPFANFDSIFPKNPFMTNSQSNNNNNNNNGPNLLELNRHINGQINSVLGQGQGRNKNIPTNVLQRRESSEERGQGQIQQPQQSEIPSHGSNSNSQPQHDQYQYEENLPSIVPSPPDPVLEPQIIQIPAGRQNLFPTSIPVLRPPPIPSFDFDNNGNLRWEVQQEERKPMQILNIQNQQPQSQNFQKTQIKHVPIIMRQNSRQQQQQQASEFQKMPEMDMIKIPIPQKNINPNDGGLPSIKLVRPNSKNQQNTRNQNQQYNNMQNNQNQQYNNNQNKQQPFQLLHVPIPNPPKSQFQKNNNNNNLPKKYQQDNKQYKAISYQQQNINHNIQLPQNPYMSNNENEYNNNNVQPTKIPAQKFQPPPLPTPPSKTINGGFLSMFNPFNRGQNQNSNNNNNNQKQQQQQQSSQQGNNHYVNPYNTRFQPPAQPPTNNRNKGVEITYVDLDDNLNPQMLVPMSHNSPQQSQRNKYPSLQPPGPPSRPRTPPPSRIRDERPQRPLSDKEKVLQAIATLNNVNYNVIQSVAEEQFGSEILDRIKAKKTQQQQTTTTTTTTTQRPMSFQILSTMAPIASGIGSIFKLMANQQQQTAQPKVHQVEDQRMSPTGLSNLLSSFGGYGDSALKNPSSGLKSPSSISSLSTDAITNLFNSLTSGEVKSKTTTTTTTTTPRPRPPIMISLDSLTGSNSMESFNPEQPQDLKALQAQLAKAILAKANRKKTGTTGPSGPFNPNPMGLISTLAQTKNYTQSQIATLKKLIALNNIEQKLNSQLGSMEQTTAKGILNNNNQFSQKMGDVSPNELNSIQSSSSSGGLHNDPTLLALKALALKKAQSIKQQQQTFKGKEDQQNTDFKPITLDLSAILSPSPPTEEPRRRRLTDIRNAPKSFYPANATQGFDATGSNPGSPITTEFECEKQTFFPGLYADTNLGCKVFHLCAKTEAGYLMKSFRCPKETVFDQEVLKCNWSLYVECPMSESKYHFNKYLSQSFQFLKVLGEFSKNATTNSGK